MVNFDVRNISDAERRSRAERVRIAQDFRLPRLQMWNYELCRKHRLGWVEEYFEDGQDQKRLVTDRPQPGCRQCGIHFRQHQRVGITWLYLVKRGLLADPMGTGKTTHAGGLLAMLKETGELGMDPQESVGRAIIVPRSPALMQWHNELLRMMPSLNLAIASGGKDKRKEIYLSPWDVLLISPQTLNNDMEWLARYKLSVLITDDIDALRNSETTTAYTLKRLGLAADRMIVMTGTPLQKKLIELHSTLEPLGGLEAFGDRNSFEARHTKKETITEYSPINGLPIGTKTVTSYQGLDEVKRKMAPMVLRRNVEDLRDVTLPTINPTDVMLDLYPLQRAKYEELRKGVITILKEEGAQTKHVTALSKLHYGAQICGGLGTLGEEDGPRTSVKMDWILDKLTSDLEDEKVVIFANYKNSVRHLQRRMTEAGIGFETVWGEVINKHARMKSQERFWEDKTCRVLIGTQAIEQSLNLQIARHLINMDMIMNPARMAQLAGRIRRDGSGWKHVFVHNLLTVNTQEERYLPLLEREAALSSHIWDENNELFAKLNPVDMMRLITG